MPKKVFIDPEHITTVDIAKMFGVTRQTVKNWEGTRLPVAQRDERGHRYWTQAQVAELKRWVK